MEKANAQEMIGAEVIRGGAAVEVIEPEGVYHVECVGPDGKVKWTDTAPNVVTTVGKNYMLNSTLDGVTIVGPYLGLISSASWSAVNVADTMSSHAGWLEAGTTNAPQWTTPASGARRSTAWSAASGSSKSLSSAVSFSISTTGTVKGCFIVLGSGAVATNLDTNGTLLSAGTFTGGDKAVGNGDTLNVSYSLALT